MRRLALLGSMLAAFTVARDSSAQNVITIDDKPQCSECRVRLEHVAQIGQSSGPELLSPTAIVAVDDDGSMLIADGMSYPGQFIYQRGGSDDWFVIGRSGDGPGEIRRVHLLWFSDRGLHVVDRFLNRESLFSREGEFIDSWQLSGLPSYVVELDNRTRVHTGLVRTRSAAGYPLHVFDEQRKITRSFGTDAPVLLPGMSERAGHRRIARANDGGLWTAPFNEYVIEKWSPSGEKLVTIRREADWFEPWTDQQSAFVERPAPVIGSIHEDERGLLWVHMNVADRDWRQQMVPEEHRPITVEERRKAWDSVIEVIDPRSGTLLVRARSDVNLWPVLGHMLLMKRDEAADGSARLTVVRMRLVDNPSDVR